MGAGEAGDKADGDEGADNAVIAGGGDDYPDEHAEQGYAKGADRGFGQEVPGHYAEGGTDRPARQGQAHGAVIVIGIQGAFSRDGDTEDFIGDIETDQHAVENVGIRGEFLADHAAHEQVAGVGH